RSFQGLRVISASPPDDFEAGGPVKLLSRGVTGPNFENGLTCLFLFSPFQNSPQQPVPDAFPAKIRPDRHGVYANLAGQTAPHDKTHDRWFARLSEALLPRHQHDRVKARLQFG